MVARAGPPLCGDFLPPWPPLQAAQLARRSPRARCFRAPHVRYAASIAHRLHAIKSAPPLTTAAGVITPHALLVQALVRHLRGTVPALEEVATAMAQRAQGHPDCPWFDALPSAGAVCAPRLLVAFGAPRHRYTSADASPQEAGIAPGTERRSKQAWGHWRLPCPPFLRQPFVAGAAAAIRHAVWARAYYPQQRDQGASHQAAVRALASMDAAPLAGLANAAALQCSGLSQCCATTRGTIHPPSGAFVLKKSVHYP
jgi:hypothetical protein